MSAGKRAVVAVWNRLPAHVLDHIWKTRPRLAERIDEWAVEADRDLLRELDAALNERDLPDNPDLEYRGLS